VQTTVRRPPLLLTLILFATLTSCRSAPDPADGTRALAPENQAQALLVNLAVLNPRLAEPLVKGVSAAAMERAVGLVVAIGVDNAGWAEGLLNRTWWLPADLDVSSQQPRTVEDVLSEVRRAGADSESEGEERQERAREALTSGVDRRDGDSGREQPAPSIAKPHRGVAGGGPPGLSLEARQRRAELEDAVQWVQFTQAWSSYYEAAQVASLEGAVWNRGSEVALDQAVTMSLVRPDFLHRLADLMAAGLGT